MASVFLITQSWERKPQIGFFKKKRALRLLSGLCTAVFLTAFYLGPISSSLPANEYFRHMAVYEYWPIAIIS